MIYINIYINIYIYIHIYIYIYIIYILYIPVQTLLVSMSGEEISTKILPVVHIFSLTIMTYLKMLIGIKSLNTKQFSARLSPPPVKLCTLEFRIIVPPRLLIYRFFPPRTSLFHPPIINFQSFLLTFLNVNSHFHHSSS